MKIDFYHICAFTDQLFGGNPAGVCPLQEWLPTEVLQRIALENCLPETAFFVPMEEENEFQIRWFTPSIEMDLCGHATLSSAYVLKEHIGLKNSEIHFHSKSGLLKVFENNGILTLDFPSRPPQKVTLPDVILKGIGATPKEVWKARDYLLVFDSEETVQNLTPNRAILDQINLDPGGIIVTARGKKVDFVSRFFTPQAHIFEDPATGSAHCTLIPFWSERLVKNAMLAHQISERKGVLYCQNKGIRVWIGGNCVTYSTGTIFM